VLLNMPNTHACCAVTKHVHSKCCELLKLGKVALKIMHSTMKYCDESSQSVRGSIVHTATGQMNTCIAKTTLQVTLEHLRPALKIIMSLNPDTLNTH